MKRESFTLINVMWRWLPGIFLISFSLVLHILIGNKFPSSWEDEAAFVFQAIAFADHGKLATPMLLNGQEVMWMPPGYMILMGWIFYFLDFLAASPVLTARFVSFIASALFVLFMYLSLRQRKVSAEFSFLGAAAVSLIPPVIAISNIGRMDSIILMLGFLSLILYLNNMIVLWILVLLVAPLFHPNGFYFWPAALPSLSKSYFERRLIIDWKIILCVVGAGILWGAYAFYVESNWVQFLNQMQFQFERKLGRSLLASISSPSNVMALLVWCCWVAMIQVREEKILKAIWDFETLFILSLIMINVVGMEIWYRGIWCAGLVYCCAGLLDHFLKQLPQRLKRQFIVLFCFTGAFAFLNYPWTWAGLSLSSESHVETIRQKICPELHRRFDRGTEINFIKMEPPNETVLLLDCLPTKNSRNSSRWIPYGAIFGESVKGRQRVYVARNAPSADGLFVREESNR